MIARIAVASAVFSMYKPFDYRIPDSLTLQPGQRVRVPFGASNRRTEGIVLAVMPDGAERPDGPALKPVEAALDPELKSSIYRLTSLSLAVFPSDFCATADHDSERRCSFVGISYLCPEIVTRHERGDIFSFVLPFLIQKRTLKVCFFWFIVVFFENHSKKYQKRAIVSPNLSPN